MLIHDQNTYSDLDIKEDYFNWLYNIMCDGLFHEDISYRKLFMEMHDTTFDFYMPLDSNRAIDGMELRCRYAAMRNNNEALNVLDDPCSVLEMMVALAIRCEETIMNDTRYGDRTKQWFWGMLSSLGIKYMTDDRFDKKIADQILYDFMERRYEPNGRGGLFYIRNYSGDLTQIEIWAQLCLYLDTLP